MTPHELTRLEARLDTLFAHHVDELTKRFVTKADFLALAAMVDRHNDAYEDWRKFKKLIFRLGLATLITSAVSPHLAWIVKFLKMLIE